MDIWIYIIWIWKSYLCISSQIALPPCKKPWRLDLGHALGTTGTGQRDLRGEADLHHGLPLLRLGWSLECHWEKDFKQKKQLFVRYWVLVLIYLWYIYIFSLGWFVYNIFSGLIRIAATGLGCSCDVPALKYQTVAAPIVLVQSHSPSCLFQVVPNVLSTQTSYQNGWWRLLVLVRIAGSYASCTAKWWTIKTGEMSDIYNT